MKDLITKTLASVLFLLFATQSTAWAGEKRQITHPPNADAGIFKTCNHYINRARFKPRNDDPTLEVILADACAQALESIGNAPHATPYEVKRARIFLSRLTTYRETVFAINAARLFGEDAGPTTQLKTPKIARSKIGRITPTGEYLIAREMGVLSALDDWADVTDFAVVATR